MDSITAIYHAKGQIDPNWLNLVQQASTWWKPLEQNKLSFNQVALTHNSAFEQEVHLPFQDKNYQCSVTFTGRIDNRLALIKAHQLVSDISNAQLVLFLYKKYSKSCPAQLIGAFAFIIWDEEQQQLFCARDQMGVQPLYYTFQKGIFAIATEKKCLLVLPNVDKSPNWEYWMLRSIVPSMTASPEATEYVGVQRLLPAHTVTVDKNGLHVQQYWQLDTRQEITYPNDQDYLDAFLEHWERAVADRMVGSEQVGAHLSGGLDSAGVAGTLQFLAHKQGQIAHTFSYTVPKRFEKTNLPFENENPYINAQIAFSNIAHAYHIIRPQIPNLRVRIEQEALVMDGLSQSNNFATEYEVQLMARLKNVPIVLSGFGGDELVTSFVRAYYLEYLEKGQYLPYFSSTPRASFKRWQLLIPFLVKMGKAVGWSSIGTQLTNQYNQYWRRRRPEVMEVKKHLFKDSFIKTHPSVEQALSLPIYSETHTEIPVSLRQYQSHHICRQHTSRRMEAENQAGRNFKIQYRYPFTDIRLLQYVLSIPVEQKWSSNISRYLYRRAMKSYIAPSILERNNKQGSVKPMTSFFQPEVLKSSYALYDELMEQGFLDFVDNQKVLKYRVFKQIPRNFYMYLMIGQLRATQKLNY